MSSNTTTMSTTPTPRKTRLLLVGLDPISGTRALPDIDGAELAAELDASVARMRAERDVSVDVCYLHVEEAVPWQRLETQLKTHAFYDALMVGHGLRALPPFSGLFEEVLEVVRSAAPRDTRVLFSTTPSDHLETLRKRFPKREV